MRVLVVYKKSAYQIYVEERGQTQFTNIKGLVESHRQHLASMELARKVFRKLDAHVTFRYRSRARQSSDFDLIVTLGGDGTVLEAARHAGRTPLVCINTAPDSSRGYFCAGTAENMEGVLRAALAGELKALVVERMVVRVDKKLISKRVLNDILFCHHNPAATSRYTLGVAAQGRKPPMAETQRSSGVWVCTAAGSTGAMQSAGGRRMPIRSKSLQYVARELCAPWDPESRQGFVEFGNELVLTSHMRTGRVYIDGSRISVPVNVGSTVCCGISDEPLSILGFRDWR